MSGIAGIVNTDGAALDQAVLASMAESLRDRGPDAQRVWSSGSAGFAHTLLATVDTATAQVQPVTLDGQVWITADVRLDGRDELCGQLAAAGVAPPREATDAELILHAYAAWGQSSVERLLGDFAFAVWDEPGRTLFCARDRFGVRMFYYAALPRTLVFSNTLDCIRRHPAISSALNDLAIADFLLFKRNQESDTTAFADIRRLPPAHALIWQPGRAPWTRRYWTLSTDHEIRYRRDTDYIEHFADLLTRAVSDRLHTKRVAVSMSGGMDSSSIAALAKHLLGGDEGNPRVFAHTVVYDRLISDTERQFAGAAAQAIGVPIRFFPADDYAPFAGAARPELQLPEPGDVWGRQSWADFTAAIAGDARVAFSGDDSDALLREITSLHISALFQRGAYRDFAAAVGRYVRWFGRVPPMGIRTALKKRLSTDTAAEPDFPSWINPQLATDLELRQRWRHFWCREAPATERRPRAAEALASYRWESIFEAFDPAVTRQPLEFRYPFADSRLVQYLVAIPPIPWCTEKTVLREAMRNRLPLTILKREKTPVRRSPLLTQLAQSGAEWVDSFEPVPALDRFVVRRLVPRVTREAAVPGVHRHLRPLNLNYWLGHVSDNELKANQRSAGGAVNVEREKVNVTC